MRGMERERARERGGEREKEREIHRERARGGEIKHLHILSRKSITMLMCRIIWIRPSETGGSFQSILFV